MRAALVILLVHGLVPGAGEVVEAVAHYAIEGHLAHTAADRGDLGEQGDEHGCGTTQHRCGCCASQVVVPAQAGALLVSLAVAPGRSAAPAALVSLHEPAPPLRPPIAP
jgi:hypothetical protein